MPEGRLEIARIARPHGLRGQVMVDPVSNRRERFAVGAVHYAGGRRLVVASARNQRGRWVVGYEGVGDLDAAEALRGLALSGDPLPDDVLTEGEMWVHDIVGAEVVDGDGVAHGRIVEVEVNPAHDILVLDTGGLIPVVFVRDFGDGRVVVDVPEGLLDEEFVAANRAAVERRPRKASAQRRGKRRPAS